MNLDEPLRPCTCGNRDPRKFKYYHGDGGELFGAFCESCGKEWLHEKFLRSSSETFIVVKGQKLYIRRNLKTSASSSSAMPSHKIKYGDHIHWTEQTDRRGSEEVLFDAIVKSTQSDAGLISVIMLQKSNFCELNIGRLLIDLLKVVNLQVMEYTSGSDPVELVQSRAEAWCGLESKCNMFTTKGKVFANYCKCGPSHGWRSMWLAGGEVTMILKTVIGESWTNGRVEDCQRVVEQGHTKSKIKSGILFAMDGSAISFDVEDSIKAMQGKVNPERFLDSFIDRFIGALSDSCVVGGSVATGTTGGGIGSLEIPRMEVKVSLFVGSILKGLVVRAPQKAMGTPMGRAFGQVIHKRLIKSDEEVQLEVIEQGDHVILPGRPRHPRCHAIVVSVSATTNKLKLIRNTFEKGVVEEWVEVSPPILRVAYEDNSSYPVEDIIQRARMRLGENNYRPVRNNCRHFAYWCKRK